MKGHLHVNHEYLLDWARRLGSDAAVLDFGCGAGNVVLAGRERGLNLYGADTFEGRPERRDVVMGAGLLDGIVRVVGEDGRLPFDDDEFSLVVANQVFEHVRDLDRTLDEIARVLMPSGRLLALFPSRGVIREGHIGIPMAHWLPPGRLRYAYVHVLRSAGLGHDHWGDATSSSSEWARRTTDYLRDHTYYRRKRTALGAFEQRFHVDLIEDDYIRFRLQGRGLAATLRLPGASSVARVAMRRFSGMVVLGTKAGSSKRTLGS
jgi:SAM-dependent methyltransferase